VAVSVWRCEVDGLDSRSPLFGECYQVSAVLPLRREDSRAVMLLAQAPQMTHAIAQQDAAF
jgi:hypothetical protein